MDDEEGFTFRQDGGRLDSTRFAIRYVYASDKALLRIVTSASQPRRATSWTVQTFYYHYGPNQYDEEKTLFRVDFHPYRTLQPELHAHLTPELHACLPSDAARHVSPEHLKTNLRVISALDFVSMVKKYRHDHIYPLVLKTR